jgi:hypothetical protein
MHKRVWTLLGASAMAAVAGFVVACGDDDGGGGGDTDAGADGPNFPPGDTGTGGDTNTTKPDSGADADAGCTFAQCVIGLINTQTNATAQPDPGMCMQCTDSTSLDEFKSLFPP